MDANPDQPLRWWGRRWLELSLLWNPLPWKRGSVFYELLLYPGIWLPMLFLHLITVWWSFREIGAPLLFWHENPWMALSAGVVTSMAFAWGIFLFFALNYSNWLGRRQRVRDWLAEEGTLESVRCRKERHGSGNPHDYLPTEPHWTNRLFEHYRRFHPQQENRSTVAEGLEQIRLCSFLFRSVTCAVGYLMAAILAVRILVGGIGVLATVDSWDHFELAMLTEGGWADAPTEGTSKVVIAPNGSDLSCRVFNLEGRKVYEGEIRIASKGEPLPEAPDETSLLALQLAKILGSPPWVVAQYSKSEQRRVIHLLKEIVMRQHSGEDEMFAKTVSEIEKLGTQEESVRFFNVSLSYPGWWRHPEWGMWAFLGGLTMGWCLVLALDRVMPRVLPGWAVRICVGRRCQDQWLLMLTALFGLAVLIAAYGALLGLSHWSGRHFAAAALCVMTGVVMIYYSIAVVCMRDLKVLGTGAGVILATAAILTIALQLCSQPRYGFRNLDKPCEGLMPVQPPTSFLWDDQDNPERDSQLFPQGGANESRGVPDWEEDRPLVVICASGGGITAEVWAVDMLCLMSRTMEGFAENVRIITGASGGMVGASAWAVLEREYGFHGDAGRVTANDWDTIFGEPFLSVVRAQAPEDREEVLAAWLDLREGEQIDAPGLLAVLRRYLSGTARPTYGRRRTPLEGTLPDAPEDFQVSSYQRNRARAYIMELILKGQCRQDQLSPIAVQWALWDMSPLGLLAQKTPASLWPNWRYSDRGNRLEKVWTGGEDLKGCLPGLSTPLSTLAEDERTGRCPSLIFAPTMAEDGRQLLISNLNLARLTRAWNNPGEPSDPRVTSLEARNLFGTNLALSTFARMSATFPVITPPGGVSVRPATKMIDQESPFGQTEVAYGKARSIHLIDAGYADNSATGIAIDWLREYWLPWVRHSDGDTGPGESAQRKAPRNVVLVELDAYPRYGEEGWRFSEPRPAPTIPFWSQLVACGKAAAETWDAVTLDSAAPFRGLMNRSRISAYRNDQAIENFSRTVAQAGASSSGLSFAAHRLVNPVPASLSWTLSGYEAELLETLAQKLEIALSASPEHGSARDTVDDLANDSTTAATIVYSLRNLRSLGGNWEQVRRR